MNRRLSSILFLRSYIFIAAGILIIALVLDSLLVWLLPTDDPNNADRYAADFAMIELLLTESGTEPDAIAARFTLLSTQLEQALAMPVLLYEPAEMGDQHALFETLGSGEIASFRDGQSREILYKVIDATGQVLALGPLPDESSSLAFVETAVIISYYTLVALLLFLWIRPFYRDLSSLRHAASQFGRDDFHTRVSVAENSSIWPVAQSFNRMAERIQYLVTAHRDLTNAVAHELRTPLARFKFAMEMIPKIQDQARLQQHLNAMKTDVQELEGLIDEMLTYAKLSEDKLQLQLQTINLHAWLERQLIQYADSAIPVRLQWQPLDGEPEVRFNSDLMARALHNILRNCLRYAETEVVVICSIEKDKVSICISDDGPGIADEFHESIFEPFARLDTSRDRQSGGYGLGLAIARRILQRHKGSIHVENRRINNRPAQGASFVLLWPYN
ncbi:MAG: ATP-binding protein [Pseudohongiella sp.]|nr:ATP-binding protein [Pseudohongiella sp.]